MLKIFIGLLAFIAVAVLYIKYSGSKSGGGQTISTAPPTNKQSTSDVPKTPSSTATKPPTNSQTPVTDIFKSVKSKLDPTKSITIMNASTNNLAPLILFRDWGSQHQKLQYTKDQTLKFQSNGKCVTVFNADMSNNASIIQYDCVGTPNQGWIYDNNGQYRSKQDQTKCLTLLNASAENETPIRLFECNNALHQQWQ